MVKTFQTLMPDVSPIHIMSIDYVLFLIGNYNVKYNTNC